MRLSLICSVLALTALIFFAALRSIPATDNTATAESAAAAGLEEATAQIEANQIEFDQQIAAANQTIADLRDENADQSTTLEATATERAELQSQLENMNERLGVVEAANAALESDKNSLTQELAALTAGLESSENATREAEVTIQSLNDAIVEGREEAQTLQARIAALESERDQLTQQLAEQENNAVALSAAENDEVAQAQALLEQRAQDLAAAEDRIAALTEMTTAQEQTTSALTEQIEGLELQVTSLSGEASGLADEVAKRDTVIAGLIARTGGGVTSPVAGCQEKTDAVLAEAKVSFEAGSTTIDSSSLPLLEILAAIASDCVQQNLTLEIEGHTGSAGGVASNLLLSDGQAKAVRDFLIEKGVQASSVRAVGFGGSDPIADNETSDGQSLNQRIVFDWEQS